MPYDPEYHEEEPTRDELAGMAGPVVLEFGASWCGICGHFAPQFESLMQRYPEVRHIKVEDRGGKPLGRSFRVKLWPTLVFLRDGEIIEQMSRPTCEEAQSALDAITAGR